ncbi:MAG TPA: acetamidase/formamidase family protein [Chloroflexota bacterium]|nr:acetamidase/formamidase family protein [Chloroflexota bacterium]
MAVYTLRRDDDRAIHYKWNAALLPVLRVPSGSEVTVETRSGEDDQLRQSSTSADVDALDMRRLHALSGPVFIEEALPGDTLAVQILEVTHGDWGFTMQRPGAGFLLGFPTYLRTYDLRDGSARFGAIRIPLRPFLGVMGVAPAEPGEHSTIPPGPHGGNLDCRDLVAGSTLFLPVFVPGALFSCGDGHAAQGDGEVCVTAIECAVTARLRFDVIKGKTLARPHAESADALFTLGAAPTFEEAARQCLEDMLDLISERTGLGRADAYALASAAVDIRVNQLVNRPMIGVRAVLPRAILG